MKRNLFPFLVTTAALALAAVAPAQDRGRRDGGDKSRQERSSPSRESDRTSRSGDTRPTRNRDESRPPATDNRGSRDDSRGSRSDSRPSRDSAPDRTSRDSRPDRTNPRNDTPDRTSRDRTNPSNRNDSGTRPNPPSRDDNRDRTTRDPRQGDQGSRPDRTSPFPRNDAPNRNPRDSRPNDSGNRPNPPSRDDNRDRTNRDSRPNGSDRRDFPSRDNSSNRNSPFNRDDRRNEGWGSVRPGGYRAPSHYDGRGHVEARRYGPPPRHTSLGVQFGSNRRGGSSFAIGADFGGFRIGYVSYNGGYRRGGFGYSHYAYDPYDYACVASPWYRYSYLPPYLDRTRVVVVNNYPSSNWGWDGYQSYDYRNDRRDEGVQDALDSLRNAFERQDERDANRLVPESGDVAIFNEGRYDYSLNPEDFQGMFMDGVEQSKTLSYEILEVRKRGDEVRVRARHEYEDSWGARQSTIHTLTLRRERGGDYVIREFGSE